MPILYSDSAATFSEVVGVEEAEVLLAWLQEHPAGRLDLTACTHLHAAAVQVMMAARPAITAWPSNDGLAAWLMSAFPAPLIPPLQEHD